MSDINQKLSHHWRHWSLVLNPVLLMCSSSWPIVQGCFKCFYKRGIFLYKTLQSMKRMWVFSKLWESLKATRVQNTEFRNAPVNRPKVREIVNKQPKYSRKYRLLGIHFYELINLSIKKRWLRCIDSENFWLTRWIVKSWREIREIYKRGKLEKQWRS